MARAEGEELAVVVGVALQRAVLKRRNAFGDVPVPAVGLVVAAESLAEVLVPHRRGRGRRGRRGQRGRRGRARQPHEGVPRPAPVAPLDAARGGLVAEARARHALAEGEVAAAIVLVARRRARLEAHCDRRVVIPLPASFLVVAAEALAKVLVPFGRGRRQGRRRGRHRRRRQLGKRSPAGPRAPHGAARRGVGAEARARAPLAEGEVLAAVFSCARGRTLLDGGDERRCIVPRPAPRFFVAAEADAQGLEAARRPWWGWRGRRRRRQRRFVVEAVHQHVLKVEEVAAGGAVVVGGGEAPELVEGGGARLDGDDERLRMWAEVVVPPCVRRGCGGGDGQHRRRSQATLPYKREKSLLFF